MTNSDTSPKSPLAPQAENSATREAPLLSDRAAKALIAAENAIYSAHRDMHLHGPIASTLVARVRLGLSRFPGPGRAGDLDPTLPVAELLERAERLLYDARRVPAVWHELRPRHGPRGQGKRHRLRYPKYKRYIDKIEKRKDTLYRRRSAPSPSATAAPPRVGQ